MSAYRHLMGNPMSDRGARDLAAVHHAAARVGRLRSHALQKRVFGTPQNRLVRGDPSWLSNWIKKPLAPLVGVAEAVGGVLAAPFTGGSSLALVGQGIGTLVKSGTGAKSAVPAGVNPLAKSAARRPLKTATMYPYAFRSLGSMGLGRAYGQYSALPPAPMNIRVFRGDLTDLFGGIGTPDFSGGGGGVDLTSLISGGLPGDLSGLASMFGGIGSDGGGGGGGTDFSGGGGMTPVVSSSGGMGLLGAHFFGTSHSKAIPISQTKGIRPRGYHANKHGYFLSSIATWIMPGTVWVPNRRRNPLNPRALHRSMSRLISAKHAVKKLGLLEVPRRHRKVRAFPIRRRQRLLKAG